MISIGIFTYYRLNRLNKCINSISSSVVDEILIFNDDELNKLQISHLNIRNELVNIIKIFNVFPTINNLFHWTVRNFYLLVA